MQIKERYIDPFTDFGFKKLFGEEPNKELLVDFMNHLLEGRKQITQLTYARNEHLGRTDANRRAVFDLYCEGDRGEKFIVELQKVKQQFFKDRSLYYATFPIQEEGNKGAWNYRLSEVFTVAVMDFAFDDSYPDQYRHEVKLVETQTGEVFYDKLTLIYLEMPKFSKEASQLETHFDKWLYLLKNLNRFTDIPPVLQEPIFQRAFQIAEVANLNPQDMERYELSLKDKRDWESAIETAVEEGREKGFQQGIQEGIKEGIEKGMQEGIKAGVVEVARNLKRTGLDVALIAQATGLAPEEIEKL